MGSLDHSPSIIPELTARDSLPDAHLPSERELQNWRDLFRSAEDELDTCVRDCEHIGSY